MKLEKIFILDPSTGDEAMDRWKKETEKLYFEQLFPYFKWNDLLRFRRVSKDAKELTDKYIKTKGEKLCPEITIYETGINKDKCLSRFLELGFPATSIYIMNTSGASMFEKDAKNFAKFAEQSGPGPKITQVRIHQLANFPLGAEKAFFEGLPNLKSLLVDMYGSLARSKEEALRRESQPTKFWPEKFKQLKKVTAGNIPNKTTLDAFFGSRTLTKDCMELEFCADAFSSATRLASDNMHVVLGVAFNFIKRYIDERGEKDPTKPNLKIYDFNSFYHCPAAHLKHLHWLNSPFFIELLISCVKHSVKLFNVNSAWLQKWQPDIQLVRLGIVCPTESRDPCTLSLPVVSMVNLHGLVVPMTMPNLEKLIISATSRCSLLHLRNWEHDRKPWPALKVIAVSVDSKMLDSIIVNHDKSIKKTVYIQPETTASLMQFLFVGIQRPAVTEVSLAFVEGVDVEDVTVKAATGLGACCPNMKKLTLVNWPETDTTVIRILGDVMALEELCLDNCKKIGNLAFTKTGTTDGLIKQHPGLKKMSLKQLDKMPKLTDKLFQDVLSRMKLSHLHLSSNKALTNITPDGITALMNGDFAKSIEKFPFTGWSLENVSKEMFKKMEREFRSFDMI